MKRVFICSPYLGNVEENAERARDYCRFAISKGYNPFAPHLFYTQILDDSDEMEREQGILLGLDILSNCDELWAFMEPTKGMQKEIDYAREHNIMVKFFMPYKNT